MHLRTDIPVQVPDLPERGQVTLPVMCLDCGEQVGMTTFTATGQQTFYALPHQQYLPGTLGAQMGEVRKAWLALLESIVGPKMLPWLNRLAKRWGL
jgi:hypothetical protein